MAAPVKQPDFILLGATGFLGASILRNLEAKHSVCTSRLRLKDRLGLEALLDEQKPRLGVICAAGERGRPNIAWCDAHPVETVDANITGQLSVAAACHERGLHLILLGTGALYLADGKRKFSEVDPPNGGSPGVYTALRQKMEELTAFFNNVLVLRVLYPLSSDLDPRGLLGKLALEMHSRSSLCQRCESPQKPDHALVPLVRLGSIVNRLQRHASSRSTVCRRLSPYWMTLCHSFRFWWRNEPWEF